METDPVPCLETSDDQGPSSHVRSYECIFCKRGFTNAQALGGHMNLHRKDRTKLKQPLLFDDNKLHATSDKKSPLYSPISPNDKKSHELESTGGDRSTTAIKLPWIISREDHGEVDQNHGGEVRQLSLFVETPLSAEDRKLGCSCCSEHESMKMQSSHGSELLDLDLELRLGHEPCDTSKVGTIEFF